VYRHRAVFARPENNGISTTGHVALNHVTEGSHTMRHFEFFHTVTNILFTNAPIHLSTLGRSLLLQTKLLLAAV